MKASAAAIALVALLAPATALAQQRPAATSSAEDDADARRLEAILADAASGAKTYRLTGAWTTFGLGAAEAIGGGVVFGALKDDPPRTELGVELLILGGLGMAVSLPSFLVPSETEKLAARTKHDLADPSLPMRERVANAVGGLRTAADAEQSRRIFQIAAASVALAVVAGGEVFVLAVDGLTPEYRAGFATVFAGLGVFDLALLVDAILTRPAGRALERWESGAPAKSAVRLTPLVGPTGLGLAGTF